jgi:hypothetical protein
LEKKEDEEEEVVPASITIDISGSKVIDISGSIVDVSGSTVGEPNTIIHM